MNRVPLLMAGALVAAALNAPAALAQQSDPAPKPAPPPARQAVPRERPGPRHESAPPREPHRPQAAAPRSAPPAAPVRQAAPEQPPAQSGARRPEADSSSGSEGTVNRAVPRGARPRGDNPIIGQAVPRGAVPVIPRRRDIYYPYYPAYSPWGYGAFGLGYFYYDPYSYGYSPYGYSPYGSSSYGYSPDGYGSYSSSGYDSGSLRLKVKPRDAQVFIDGYFTGIVDDYDGILQRIRLDSGPHRVEVRSTGYEPLIVDVRIIQGQTVTYKGELRRLP